MSDDALADFDVFVKKLIASNEALRMAGCDLAIALQATRMNAKHAAIFGHQAIEQWHKTLIAIEADRLADLEKPCPIPLRIVSTSRDHLTVVPNDPA